MRSDDAQDKTALREVVLPPGWFAEDARRAQARVERWERDRLAAQKRLEQKREAANDQR